MSTVNGLQNWNYEWNITETLPILPNSTNNAKFALVILNTPLLWPFEHLSSLWKKAVYRVTVDGGTNRWFSTVQKYAGQKLSEPDYLPNLVSGDFDSILPDIYTYYKNRQVDTVFTYDQNETDFFKAVKLVVKNCPEICTVMILCEYYGRFDHSMGNLNTLYKICNLPEYQHVNLYMVNPSSIMWMLKPGKHKICIPAYMWSDKAYCSLIPLGQSCHDVTTTGLKWNLKNSTLEFGGMVSTSNAFDTKNADPVVTVHTDNYLIWCISFQHDHSGYINRLTNARL